MNIKNNNLKNVKKMKNFCIKNLILLFCMTILLFCTYLIVKVKPFGVADISQQIMNAKIVRNHDFSVMGKSYKEKIYEKYDTVQFGRYKQSIFGIFHYPIDWIVLDINDNKALLLSKYVIDICNYDEINNMLKVDFVEEAFNEVETKQLVEFDDGNTISLLNLDDVKIYFNNNEYYNSISGMSNEFCISHNIPYRTMYDNASTGTTYYIKFKLLSYLFSIQKPHWYFKLVNMNNGDTFDYLLKSEHYLSTYNNIITYDGKIANINIDSAINGIRPVICVNLQ